MGTTKVRTGSQESGGRDIPRSGADGAGSRGLDFRLWPGGANADRQLVPVITPLATRKLARRSYNILRPLGDPGVRPRGGGTVTLTQAEAGTRT